MKNIIKRKKTNRQKNETEALLIGSLRGMSNTVRIKSFIISISDFVKVTKLQNMKKDFARVDGIDVEIQIVFGSQHLNLLRYSLNWQRFREARSIK
jgi:hypothetical protein